MIRSRLFWRLYLTYALLVVLTAAAIGALIQGLVQGDLTDQIEARLWGQSAALLPVGRAALAGDDVDEIRRMVDELGRETGSRITIVTAAGVVLADSLREADQLENHGDRPEISGALATGRGTSRRFSDTLQIDQLYVARAIGEAPAAGVVRVSIPLSDVDAALADVRWVIVRGALVGIVLALGLGAFVAHRITVPIAEISAVSDALRRGDYEARVHAAGPEEIRRLGQNLNEMASELSQRLQRLMEQRAQLNAFIDAMQQAVVAIDEAGHVLFSSAVARQWLGLEEDVSSQVEPAFRRAPAIRALIEQVRETGLPAGIEVQTDHESEPLVFDARAAPFDTESARGVVLVLHDITNLRRLERVRTDFVANVSHEIKTPLTSIQGYVETLLDGAVHDQEHNVRFLQKTQTHVRRLSALVSDLLSLARIESATYRPEPVPVDWREVMAESVAQRGDPINAGDLELTLDVPPNPVRVLGDAEGMRQIVDNLLDNAIAYTPAGGSITVAVATDNDLGVLRVGDTGIGMPAEALDRIFERFYRVDRGRSRRLGGTGLGLSIVRNLVRRMDGHISVESEVGSGSTFAVSLPLA